MPTITKINVKHDPTAGMDIRLEAETARGRYKLHIHGTACQPHFFTTTLSVGTKLIQMINNRTLESIGDPPYTAAKLSAFATREADWMIQNHEFENSEVPFTRQSKA